MQVREVVKDVFVIDKFFSKEECEQHIAASEKIGYETATIETEKGAKVMNEVRNNDRVMLLDKELVSDLWKKLKTLVPQVIGKSEAVGLNELIRFYKYEPGQLFKKHIDQPYIRNDLEASYYTFMIYLNDGYEGGETRFNNTTITGSEGMALIFAHSLEHEGAEVKRGMKYILRTDVMYRLQEENI